MQKKPKSERFLIDRDWIIMCKEHSPIQNNILSKLYDYATVLRDVPNLEHYFLTNKAKDENYKGKNPNETKFDRDYRNRLNALLKNGTLEREPKNENPMVSYILHFGKGNAFREMYKDRLSEDLEFDSTGIKNCFDNFLQEVEKRVEKGLESSEISKEIKKEFIGD